MDPEVMFLHITTGSVTGRGEQQMELRWFPSPLPDSTHYAGPACMDEQAEPGKHGGEGVCRSYTMAAEPPDRFYLTSNSWLVPPSLYSQCPIKIGFWVLYST